MRGSIYGFKTSIRITVRVLRGSAGFNLGFMLRGPVFEGDLGWMFRSIP